MAKYQNFLSFLLIALLLLLGAASEQAWAQSTDPSEIRLRADFLRLLDRGDFSLEQLKPYYLRPEKIPYRIRSYAPEPLIELGRNLFFDPRLSASGNMSCATCHNPSLKWTDGLATSVEGNNRRTMALYNLAWDGRFLWEGRVGSLMSQAILALTAPSGMGASMFNLADKLRQIEGYKELFLKAFPDKKEIEQAIHPDTIALALEIFQSSITSGKSRFDLWVAGDNEALDAREIEGFLLFNTKANCARCHNSWRFSDSNVYDIGLSNLNVKATKAVGLRNIEKRPPYMHDGRFTTLQEVLTFYNQGGEAKRAEKSPWVKELHLSPSEIEALAAFLLTLNDEEEVVIPVLPR
jgi:cytochrome c peroxidase